MGLLLNGSSWIKSTTNYVRASTNHTVMYWLRLDNSSTTRRPFGNTGTWEARTSGTTLTSDYLQSGTLGTATLSVGTMQHVAFVQDVSGTTRYAYVDGQLVNTINGATFSGQQTGLMSIGVTPGGASQGWHGVIDDIRVYDRVMPQEEIETIYACEGNDGIYDDLVIWYPLNEGAEGAAVAACYEHTGNGPDCVTVTGTPTYNYDAGIKWRRAA